MKPVDLQPHPEGGCYREVFRSPVSICREDGVHRSARTHIYFSLTDGEVSRFHRVQADEVWNLYRGHGLWLYTWDGTATSPCRHELSAAANCYCHVVPAGIWQAAEPVNGEVLMGCSVGPGFDFAGVELIDPAGEPARRLASQTSMQHLIA